MVTPTQTNLNGDSSLRDLNGDSNLRDLNGDSNLRDLSGANQTLAWETSVVTPTHFNIRGCTIVLANIVISMITVKQYVFASIFALSRGL